MNWKKLGKALLFPHMAILIILLPIATVLLVYSMVFVGTESVVATVSYVLAAYTLTVWCFRIPNIIRFVKTFKDENKYAKALLTDARLRVNLSLFGSLLWNTAYAIFQLGLGFYYGSFWYYTMAAYYISLVIMRFFLARHTRAHKPGEEMKTELVKYRACGWVFLVMNLALTSMIFFMVYLNRTFQYHEIITIAMATYTFTAFTVAIVNLIRYRRYNSPVFTASKAISLAAACVSMLTLESAMLTSFGEGESESFRQMMLGGTGAAVCIFIVVMAIYMITQSTKKIKCLQVEEGANGEQ